MRGEPGPSVLQGEKETAEGEGAFICKRCKQKACSSDPLSIFICLAQGEMGLPPPCFLHVG